MAQPVTSLLFQGSVTEENDRLHMQSDPLRTGAGFVLGTALSGTFWIIAGTVVWYLT